MNKKVLWLTENFFPQKGGMAESCDRIVHQLRLKGLEIDVFYFSDRVQKISKNKTIKGENISFPIEADLAHSLNLAWLFIQNEQKKKQYSHVVSFGGFTPIFAGPVFSSWLGLPLITLLRGNDFDTAMFDPKRREQLVFCLKRSAYICSVSKEKTERILALFPGLKTLYIPNGILLENWKVLKSDEQKALEWKSTYPEKDRMVLGIFGYLKSKKGLLFFLECLMATGLQDRFHLLIVGEMSEDVKLYLEANKDLLHHTHYPFMERYALIPYYLAADFIAIPSFYDGLPNVLLEAGALSKPFIASKAAGMEDVLEEGKDAFLFNAYDSEDCKKAIQRMVAVSTEKTIEMGRYCKEKIHGNFNHEIEAQRYFQLFQES